MFDAVTTQGTPPSAPARASESGGTTFYRYRDAEGRLVIVDTLSRVPARARGSVQSIVLDPTPAPSVTLSERALHEFHLPSFVAGAGAGLLLGFLVFGLRHFGTRLLRFGVLAAVVMLGAGAYFGWVRQSSGLGGSLVTTPAALIQDAQRAVEKMNERSREQERVLKELESER